MATHTVISSSFKDIENIYDMDTDALIQLRRSIHKLSPKERLEKIFNLTFPNKSYQPSSQEEMYHLGIDQFLNNLEAMFYIAMPSIKQIIFEGDVNFRYEIAYINIPLNELKDFINKYCVPSDVILNWTNLSNNLIKVSYDKIKHEKTNIHINEWTPKDQKIGTPFCIKKTMQTVKPEDRLQKVYDLTFFNKLCQPMLQFQTKENLYSQSLSQFISNLAYVNFVKCISSDEGAYGHRFRHEIQCTVISLDELKSFMKLHCPVNIPLICTSLDKDTLELSCDMPMVMV